MQTDAQGSVTSLMTTAGAVYTRFLYSPMGAMETRDAAFGVAGARESSFVYGHGGRRYDALVQLYVQGADASGGSAFDPVGERAIVEDAGKLSAERNAYDPHMEWFTQPAWVRNTSTAAAVVGTVALGGAGLMVAGPTLLAATNGAIINATLFAASSNGALVANGLAAVTVGGMIASRDFREAVLSSQDPAHFSGLAAGAGEFAVGGLRWAQRTISLSASRSAAGLIEAPLGRFGGELYGEARLAKHTSYLNRRGINVVRSAPLGRPNAAGALDPFADTPTLYLPENATKATIWHEL